MLRVYFGEIGHLNTLASHYAMVPELSQSQARLDLAIDAYIWAIWLYQKKRAHIQHRLIIMVSLAWCSFAFGIYARKRKGCTADDALYKCRTKNTKPRNPYDVEQYSKDFENGNTIMQKYGDPLSVMCCIAGFLTNIYEDARLQNLAVTEPKPSNLQGIDLIA